MPPVVIGAGIAAAGAVGAAAIGSKAASKASKAQAQAADQSTAVQQQIYGENKQTLAPYVQAGIPATQAINSFLGLSQPQQPSQQTQAMPNALAQYLPGYEGMDGPMAGYGGPLGAFGGFGGGFGGGVPMGQPQQPQGVNGRDAFRAFLDNSDYAFQREEGLNALNSGWAGAGMLQSGAALKDSIRFGKDLDAGYRGEWLNSVGNQQSVGLQAAGAQAGVGTNYANSLGSINQARADGLSNAALLKAQNIGNAINGATSSIAYMIGKK